MGGWDTTKRNLSVIDGTAVKGLNAGGVGNSLAYKVHEIEKHFHGIERWYGNAGVAAGGSWMATASNLLPWVLTAGINATKSYGRHVKLSDPDDIHSGDMGYTPVKFDLHRIQVCESNQNDSNYTIQIWSGTASFGTSTLRSEFPYRTSNLSGDPNIITIQMNRISVAEKLWARCRCETDGKTVSILVGAHGYPG